MSERLKLLVVTEIEPAPTTASGAVLHRHLESVDADLLILAGNSSSFQRPRWISSIMNRIAMFFPHFIDRCVENTEPKLLAWLAARKLRNQNFDVLLTLAHARMGLHAWRIAKRLKIPVVTIFHDWWPELFAQHSRGNNKTIQSVIRDFEACQKNSDLSLAVCPGMKRHLKYSRRTEVLYPMPDKALKPFIRNLEYKTNITVVYTGSLWHPYGAMLEKLIEACSSDAGITFKIYGDQKYLPVSTRIAWKNNKILHEYVSGEEYNNVVTKKADILLAVMGEDENGCIRMQTSFPSKVANYFRTGNQVLLWAPATSSLGEFCKENDYEWWVSSSDPKDVLTMIQAMAKSPKTQQGRGNRVKYIFDPDIIQNRFIEQIRSCATKGKNH